MLTRSAGAFVLTVSTVSLGGIALYGQPQQPAPSAQPTPSDIKKQMNAMNENSRMPVEQHEALNLLAGEFDAHTEMHLGNGEAITVNATTNSHWVVGGRFLEMESVSAPGEDLKGERIVMYGYDPTAKNYTMWQVETSNPTAATATGDYDASTKTFTFTGKRAVAGMGALPFKWVLKSLDKGAVEQTIQVQMPGAADYQEVVKVTYTPKEN